jgi:hypothetical protein
MCWPFGELMPPSVATCSGRRVAGVGRPAQPHERRERLHLQIDAREQRAQSLGLTARQREHAVRRAQLGGEDGLTQGQRLGVERG